MTLIELMVALAISTVVAGAAVAGFVALVRIDRDSALSIRLDTRLRTGVAVMEREVVNAGLRFEASRYAFVLHNNVDDEVGEIAAVAADSTDEGIIEGTDVLELAWGDPVARQVGSVGECLDESCTAVQLHSFAPLTVHEVFSLGEVSGAPALPTLLFATADQTVSCLARVQSGEFEEKLSIVISKIDLDETPIVLPNGECPRHGMLVYALAGRARYMVYQGPGGAERGLYRQESIAYGSTVISGDPELLVEGIEDFQVAPRVWNASNASWGPISSYVDCNMSTTTACVLDGVDDSAGNRQNELTLTSSVRGVTIGFSARSAVVAEALRSTRQALMDHAAGTQDNRAHSSLTFSVTLMNLVLESI